MLTLHAAFYQLKNELQSLYDAQEASAISHELLHHITGLSKYERLIEKEQILTSQQHGFFTRATQRLVNGEPLQYIIGVQWFMGKAFEVNKHVLIPRPETEELVQWIVEDRKAQPFIRILDIGTGSGCIPVSLKLQLPQAQISTGDISDTALEVAGRNALKHGVDIELLELDFLDERTWPHLGQYDVIVSNPPYIPLSEKQNLHRNVAAHEPALALFVEEDALIFYRKIAAFAQEHLKPGGAVYCEVHKAHAYETRDLFQQFFKQVLLKKDMSENERMVKGWNEAAG